MQNFKLNDEFRDKLLESAAWGKCGINLSESKAQEAEEIQKPLEEDDDEENGDPKAFGGKKGDKSKTKKGKDFEKKKKKKKKDNDKDDNGDDNGDDDDDLEEAVHVCPLCISQLEEAIDEERLVEHMDVILGLIERLSALNEDEEDVDQVIDSALKDLLMSGLEQE